MPSARLAVFDMIFLGTQPTLTQVPPSRPGSMRITRAPHSAARCAQASPPLPPPITARSYLSAMTACYTAPGRMPPMPNPLLAAEPLPRFDQIQPKHIEPAIRDVLDAGRARV